MCCNIHLHTEVKINGVWHHYSCLYVHRNYQVFAKMAGVKNDGSIIPIVPPRGLPEDATDLTLFNNQHWGKDGHDHSWLSAEEITQLVEYVDGELKLPDKHGYGVGWWCNDNFGYFFGNTWGGFWKYRNDKNSSTPKAPKGVEDIRFVFWFDS